MASQRFRAVIAAGPRDSAVIMMPFDPDEAWGAKADHPVSGTMPRLLPCGPRSLRPCGMRVPLMWAWTRAAGANRCTRPAGAWCCPGSRGRGPRRGDGPGHRHRVRAHAHLFRFAAPDAPDLAPGSSARGNSSWSPWSPRATPTPRLPRSCTSPSAPSARTWTGSETRPAAAAGRPDPPGPQRRLGLARPPLPRLWVVLPRPPRWC